MRRRPLAPRGEAEGKAGAHAQASLLVAISNEARPLRQVVGTNIATVVAAAGFAGWPQLLPALVACLESDSLTALDGALDALYKVRSPAPAAGAVGDAIKLSVSVVGAAAPRSYGFSGWKLPPWVKHYGTVYSHVMLRPIWDSSPISEARGISGTDETPTGCEQHATCHPCEAWRPASATCAFSASAGVCGVVRQCCEGRLNRPTTGRDCCPSSCTDSLSTYPWSPNVQVRAAVSRTRLIVMAVICAGTNETRTQAVKLTRSPDGHSQKQAPAD